MKSWTAVDPAAQSPGVALVIGEEIRPVVNPARHCAPPPPGEYVAVHDPPTALPLHAQVYTVEPPAELTVKFWTGPV